MGTLNLSQEMSDKMKNKSGQFNYIELRKRQKCGQNWPFLLFFWHYGRLLWTEWTYWNESFKILSGIFWHKFRVPTRGSLAPNGPYRLKNGPKRPKMAENGQFLKILACMWCGYSKPVPGDVWQDAKWIRTITLHWTEKTSKIWSKLTIFGFFSDLLDVYYDPNEHIDMNPIKFCQASSDTNLEYQQGVDWLQMARTASKMAQNGQF